MNPKIQSFHSKQAITMGSVSKSVFQVVSTTTTTTSIENMEASKKSLFAMSDAEILEDIYATHEVSHDHDSFDVHSLFSITQSIIKCSKQIVDSIDQKVCMELLYTTPLSWVFWVLKHL